MIKHLLFDLDNTLYPASSAIDRGITLRMTTFVSEFLQVPPEQAATERAQNLKRYGTTLEWLMTEKNLSDTDAFFAYIHPDSETSELPPDPNLRSFLQSLNIPISILTNSPTIHATRVLDFYNISDLFVGVYDLQCMQFKGKPHHTAYLFALEQSGFSIEETLFFDDHVKYLKGYDSLGGKSILINAHGTQFNSPYPVLKSIYDIQDVLSTLDL